MPLLAGKKNIGHNIKVEEEAGKPRKQAVAIALSKARGKDIESTSQKQLRLAHRMLADSEDELDAARRRGEPASIIRDLIDEVKDAQKYLRDMKSSAKDALPLPVPVNDSVGEWRTGRGPTSAGEYFVEGKFAGHVEELGNNKFNAELESGKHSLQTSAKTAKAWVEAAMKSAKDALPLPVGKDFEVDDLGDKLAKMLPSNNECRVINQKVVNGKGATRREKIIAEAFRTLNSGGSVRVYKSLIQELKTAKDALPLPVAVRGRDVGHCAQCPTCKKYVGVVEGKFLNHSGEGNSSNERCAMSGKSVAVGNKFHAADSPRTDEDAYFKRRKEIKAKLDKKNPGDDTNKLRAHEQAMREAGKKVEPYRTANDGSGWAEEGTKRFFKGEAVRNTVGETGVVVEQNGTTVIVQPSRHTGSPENWHASKTFLLNLKKVKDNMQNEADIKSGFKMAKKADELAGKGDFSGAIRLYEQARNYLKSDPNFVAEIDEALKAARSGKAYDSFSPITLQEAQHQEVAQDHATAMDSYRQAAAGFRKIGDQRNEQIARDGIAECQRQAVRSYHGQYEHPSVGKVQAFDAAPDALRSAVERTRAGEVVRVAHDEATGEEVVEPAKDAEWKPSVWKPGTKTVILKKGSKEDKEAKRLEHNHVAQESRRTKSAKDVASDGTCDMCGAKIPKNRKGV